MRPLVFWRVDTVDYPLLCDVASSVLGSWGSSAASERDVSTSGMVMRKDRSALLPHHLEMHCLVRFIGSLLPPNRSTVPYLTPASRAIVRAGVAVWDVHAGATASEMESEIDSDEASCDGRWEENSEGETDS